MMLRPVDSVSLDLCSFFTSLRPADETCAWEARGTGSQAEQGSRVATARLESRPASQSASLHVHMYM